MDYNKLINKDLSGTYCLLFQNKLSLTVEKINIIFSNFGKVHSIKTTGDEKGYRFVRYNNLSEAQNAIEALKNNPAIKFVQPLNRKKKKTENRTDLQNKKEIENKQTSNGISDKEDNNSKKIQYLNQYMKNKKNDNVLSKLIKVEKCLSSDNSPKYVEKSLDNSKENSITEKSNESQKFDESQSFNSSYLNSIDENQIENFDDKIPDLITSKEKIMNKHHKHKKIILNAEEIIVGNIHPNFGASYILHLFDNFEPIAITYIKLIPNSNIRYCHVYFKTVEDALKVETLFDETLLINKKLVVLRPCRLMIEATC